MVTSNLIGRGNNIKTIVTGYNFNLPQEDIVNSFRHELGAYTSINDEGDIVINRAHTNQTIENIMNKL